MENVMQVRVTGILIESEKVLLVKQKVANRDWSLPGGRVENGETLEEAMIREMKEETGLDVKVKNLLYVCDKPDALPSLLHITYYILHFCLKGWKVKSLYLLTSLIIIQFRMYKWCE